MVHGKGRVEEHNLYLSKIYVIILCSKRLWVGSWIPKGNFRGIIV